MKPTLAEELAIVIEMRDPSNFEAASAIMNLTVAIIKLLSDQSGVDPMGTTRAYIEDLHRRALNAFQNPSRN